MPQFCICAFEQVIIKCIDVWVRFQYFVSTKEIKKIKPTEQKQLIMRSWKYKQFIFHRKIGAEPFACRIFSNHIHNHTHTWSDIAYCHIQFSFLCDNNSRNDFFVRSVSFVQFVRVHPLFLYGTPCMQMVRSVKKETKFSRFVLSSSAHLRSMARKYFTLFLSSSLLCLPLFYFGPLLFVSFLTTSDN